ncbi:MAG: peptidylprolyl isomerase [Kofleriaceae bacterium]
MKRIALLLLLAAPLVASCEKAKSKLDPTMETGKTGTVATGSGAGSNKASVKNPHDIPTPGKDIDSKEILARSETAQAVSVKHVLIGWKDLAASYRGQMDPRAAKRTNDEAVALAKDTLAKLTADPKQLDKLVAELSEDPGSKGGDAYEVKADTAFVPEFKNLALRLKVSEAGIVKTNYGYHVIMRIPPPPPDPLESTDILARTEVSTAGVKVQHVLIGWKGAPGARAATRTKQEADELTKKVFELARSGKAMPDLMKEYSEDPGSKDNARIYDVAPDAPMVEPFKNLSLRLKENEVGVVKSPFGFHVIKRVPPPPPDSLESADILKREPTTKSAKVKHILLGWKEVHADDERGKKRERPALEKLVKDTVAKLKGGAKIEALMTELSEDPGSAKSGESYDVTPDAGLVPPFKNLSLRLNVGEVGVVRTDFGIHIIQRVDGLPGQPAEKPPGPAGKGPDPHAGHGH